MQRDGGGERSEAGTNSPTIGERLTQLLAGDGKGAELPREFLDAWVNSGRTNADDLLAARQAGGGVEFLRKALADLEAAKGKPAIRDYTLEAMVRTEELYLEAGKSPAESKMLGSSTAVLPHLAQMKN